MTSDLIINFTPTGMIPTKEMTPFVPISTSEIIEDVHEAWEIGITMVHLHARDPVTGDPTYKAEIYGEIISGIRKFAKNLIVCVSLSGRNFKEIEKRAAPLTLEGHLKPDMGSLTLSSLNFNKQASITEPEIIKALAHLMKEKEVAPELEVFDVGMINYARYLTKKKLIAPPYYFNLMLGNVACAQPDPLHVGVMLRDLPDHSYWSIAGIGNYQMMMNSMSIAVGGGVRVGLEDNIWFDRKRTTLARNADFLKRIHMLAEANERMLMPASELRKKLKLCRGSNGHYGLSTNQSLP